MTEASYSQFCPTPTNAVVDPGWRSLYRTGTGYGVEAVRLSAVVLVHSHATRSFPASGLASTARRAPIRTPGGISSSALVDAITCA